MRQTDVEKARARERNLRWMESLWEGTSTSAKEEDLPRSTTHDASPPVSGRYAVLERGDTTRSQWNAWTEGSPGGGHLLQSYEWGEIKRALKWRPVRLVLQREDEVVGVGQFVTYSTPLVPGVLMYCPKGPWLPWEDEEAVRTFFRGLLHVAIRHRAHTIKIEPEVTEDSTRTKELLAEIGFKKFRWNVNHKMTTTVDLELPEDELLANMKKGTRYGVRRAIREGVKVVEDNSPGARDVFWRMHGEMVDRKNFWSRPHSYYSVVWKAMEDAGRSHLFFAEHEGDRLAAALFYTFGRKCIYMLGTSKKEKRELQPAYALQWEAMRWAKQRGITRYDMWGISKLDKPYKDHPLYGVSKFKAGFGGGIENFLGCLDLPVSRVRARAWDGVEPLYFRAYQRLKGDVYY
jgi:peptidoglycan pentaglycine glycine transferase (the first glycine)